MRRALIALFTVHTALLARPVLADPAPAPLSPMQEAGKHFERGVSLFDEADYRAALVEFRRAYEIAPNAVVLYNIGETYYQLQNYAAAMTALDRYLNESGESAEHRPEVQKTLAILRTRVGKVEITTNVPGCEITVDDEFVGKTPFTAPVSISIGRRKITAMRAGLPPDTRFVEVAAGDTATAALTLADPTDHGAAAGAPGGSPDADSGSGWRKGMWTATAVLGAGAITTGIIAIVESHQLQNDRDSFGATHDELSSKASRVTTFSAIADITGVLAIASGVVALKLTLSQSDSHEVHAVITPTGVALGGSSFTSSFHSQPLEEG